MPLTRVVALAALAALVLSGGRERPARASIASFVKGLGGDLGEGAAEKLKPTLASTLADAETRVTRAEDHIGNIANGLVVKLNNVEEERLDQAKDILQTTLLQAQVSATELTDHALSGVDELLKNRLADADALATHTISNLDAAGQDLLRQADTILHDRIAQLGTAVDDAVEKANRSLEARIEQLDEVTGRRLGNVDVIASKQRIALEETAVHIAVLVGLVVFVVFVLRRLWSSYLDSTAGERWGSGAAFRARGAARTWMFAKGLGGPLLRSLVVAGLAAGLLFVLYDRLPSGARKQEQALVLTHEGALAQSLARFDFTLARYHASQLELLEPGSAGRYQGLGAKAELLRDLFQRPTLLATEAGLTETSTRIANLGRALGPVPDPDVLVMQAMVLWESGGTRREEQKAASLCARAIRLGAAGDGGGFALAPLARAYVETFLEAPYVDAQAGLGRDVQGPRELRAVLATATPPGADHPLAARLALLRLMRTVDARTSTAYATMVGKHAKLLALLGARPVQAAEADAARAARNAAAHEVVTAWADFDRALLAAPELARDPAVLGVFRLNDTTYTRAKWFEDHPEENRSAPLLGARPAAPAAFSDKELATRMRLIPPRVVWARRYRVLMAGPAREVLELQEAGRFAQRERAAAALEQALVAAEAAPTDQRTARQVAAALAAARMGLYVGGDKAGQERRPLGRELAPGSDDEALLQALAARGLRLI